MSQLEYLPRLRKEVPTPLPPLEVLAPQPPEELPALPLPKEGPAQRRL